MTPPDAVKFLAAVGAMFPGWAVPTGDDLLLAARTWAEVFRSLSLDEVLAGLTSWATENGAHWPPSAPELYAFTLDLAHDLIDPAAEDPWGEVTGELARVGHVGSPRFSHPEIGQAVDAIGGWAQLCRSTSIGYDRAAFGKAYDRILARSRRERLLAPTARGTLGALGQRMVDTRGVAGVRMPALGTAPGEEA